MAKAETMFTPRRLYGTEKFGDVLAQTKVTLSWLMGSNMVKPEQVHHLHLVYHFTVPLNKILKKYLRKSSFSVKLHVLKMKSFTCVFKIFAISLSNLIHEFWEGCFPKPKLLLVVERLIGTNVSIGT